MEATTAAVVAMGLVALVALGVAAYTTTVLAGAARERRDDLVRLVIAERKASLALSSGELEVPASLVARATTDATKGPAAALQPVEIEHMHAADMDPTDPEAVDMYRRMKARGYDPADPADMAYWNDQEPM